MLKCSIHFSLQSGVDVAHELVLVGLLWGIDWICSRQASLAAFSSLARGESGGSALSGWCTRMSRRQAWRTCARVLSGLRERVWNGQRDMAVKVRAGAWEGSDAFALVFV